MKTQIETAENEVHPGRVHPQGRMWQWLGVLLLVLLAVSVLIMVAAAGGAL